MMSVSAPPFIPPLPLPQCVSLPASSPLYLFYADFFYNPLSSLCAAHM